MKNWMHELGGRRKPWQGTSLTDVDPKVIRQRSGKLLPGQRSRVTRANLRPTLTASHKGLPYKTSQYAGRDWPPRTLQGNGTGLTPRTNGEPLTANHEGLPYERLRNPPHRHPLPKGRGLHAAKHFHGSRAPYGDGVSVKRHRRRRYRSPPLSLSRHGEEDRPFGTCAREKSAGPNRTRSPPEEGGGPNTNLS